MASLGAKLAVTGGSTAAVGGAGAGIYLTQGAEANAVETINEQSTLSKEEIKSPKAKENQVPDKPKTKQEFVPPSKNRLSKPLANSGDTNEDSVLNRYWLYLLDTTNKDNEYWWNEKFKLWQQEQDSNLDNLFKNLTKGYSNEEEKSLNKTCEKVYKQEDPNFKNETTVTYKTNRDKFSHQTSSLSNNLWKFCSFIDAKPKNLNEADESVKNDGDRISHRDYFASYLVATKTNENNKFWEIKDKWFKELVDSTEPQSKEKFLTYAKTRNNGQDVSHKPLKEICRSTYEDSHINGNDRVALILTYCSYLEYPFNTWFPVVSTPSR